MNSSLDRVVELGSSDILGVCTQVSHWKLFHKKQKPFWKQAVAYVPLKKVHLLTVLTGSLR